MDRSALKISVYRVVVDNSLLGDWMDKSWAEDCIEECIEAGIEEWDCRMFAVPEEWILEVWEHRMSVPEDDIEIGRWADQFGVPVVEFAHSAHSLHVLLLDSVVL
jgi:hypothetical protein